METTYHRDPDDNLVVTVTTEQARTYSPEELDQMEAFHQGKLSEIQALKQAWENSQQQPDNQNA